MAGLPWFKLESDFADHPKVERLALRLGDPNAGMYVVRLWTFCARHAPSGRLDGDDASAVLERAMRWTGKTSGALVDALASTGFVERADGGLVVHGWEERNGAHARKRERDASKPRGNRSGPSRVPPASLPRPSAVPPESSAEPSPVPPESGAGEVEREVEREYVRTSSSSDPLAEWQRGLAAELAVMSSTPFRVKPERVPGMRQSVEILGVEAAVTLCAGIARDLGKVPGTGDYFERPLAAAAEEAAASEPPAFDPYEYPTDEQVNALAGDRP